MNEVITRAWLLETFMDARKGQHHSMGVYVYLTHEEASTQLDRIERNGFWGLVSPVEVGATILFGKDA